VAHLRVRGEPLGVHTAKHGNLVIDVVVDSDIPLRGVSSVKATGILDNRAFPRNWHREQEGVQRGSSKPSPM
jgi:hypothetical protein